MDTIQDKIVKLLELQPYKVAATKRSIYTGSFGNQDTVVCCAAQENGACVHNMSILTRRTKYDFMRVHSSMVS